MHVGVPYFKITSSVRKLTVVVAEQSLTAFAMTNFDSTSVNDMMYRFPRRDVGVIGPWKSMLSNFQIPLGGGIDHNFPGGF